MENLWYLEAFCDSSSEKFRHMVWQETERLREIYSIKKDVVSRPAVKCCSGNYIDPPYKLSRF